MLFLSGQISGAVAAENAYDSPELCDHDADCEGRAAGGFEQLLINTSADLAPGGDGVARQAPVPDDRRAEEHRGCLEESLPRLCGDALPGHELSHDFTDGQDQDAARVDEEGRRVRHLQNAAFCARVEQDQSAVEAAVEQGWSNGPVEGHINRLKTLKRQMYGRAGFELLRARVLPLPPPAILHQE